MLGGSGVGNNAANQLIGGAGDDHLWGGGWTDFVALDGMGGGPSAGGTWNYLPSSASVTGASSGTIDLSADAAGIITFSDGSSMTFTGIERIAY